MNQQRFGGSKLETGRASPLYAVTYAFQVDAEVAWIELKKQIEHLRTSVTVF